MPIADEVIVDLQIKAQAYLAKLAQVEATFDKRIAKMERTRIDLGPAGSAAARSFNRVFGSLLPALTAATVVKVVQSAVKGSADLLDFSERVGISAGELQKLQYAAKLSGAEVESFNGALAFFSRQIGQAARGGGDLYEILTANNVAIRDSNGNVRSQNDLLLEFANLVKNAASEQERATLIQKGMGRGAEELGSLFRQGADGIRTLTEEAAKVGALIPDAELQKARELDDAFDRLALTIGSKLKAAIINATFAIKDFFEFQQKGTAASSSAIEAQIARLQRAVEQRKGQIFSVSDALFGANAADEAEIARLQNALAQRARFESSGGMGGATKPTGPATILPSTDKKELDEFQKATLALTERTAAMEVETQVLGLSNREAEKRRMILELTNAAMRASGTVTEAQILQIERLSEAYAQSVEEFERAAAVQERIQAATDAAFDATSQAFTDVITQAKTFKEALVDVLKQLALIAAKNWFASLFSPTTGAAGGIFSSIGKLLGFAEGGVMTPQGPRSLKRFASGGVSNKAAIFGEGGGSEAAVPLPDGRSIPVRFKNDKTKRASVVDNSTRIELRQMNDFRNVSGVDRQWVLTAIERAGRQSVAASLAAWKEQRNRSPNYVRGDG